jgi:hypothetical protein
MTHARRLARLLFATLLAVMVVSTAVAVASPPNPFLGPYQSTDSADSSNQFLALGGPDHAKRVTLFDDYGTVCETDGDGTGSGVIATGIGEVTDDTLTVTFSLHCFNGKDVGDAEIDFTDEGDGTLSDSGSPGTVWERP